MITVQIKPSHTANKKLTAIFFKDGKQFKAVHFGDKRGSQYPTHRDEIKKQNYIKRHKVREDWEDPYSRGALSRWILWNKPTLKASILDYKKRFNFK